MTAHRLLTPAQVRSIRKEYAELPRVDKKGYGHVKNGYLKALADKYELTRASIIAVASRRTYVEVA